MLEVGLSGFSYPESRVIKDYGGIDITTTQLQSSANNTQMIEFSEGDILISNIRPYLKKCWLAECDGKCGTDILVLRPNKLVEPYFLYLLIANDDFFDYVMQGAKGTKMPRGDKKHILARQVMLPPLALQKTITRFFKELNIKITLVNKQTEKLQRLKKALMQQMFV